MTGLVRYMIERANASDYFTNACHANPDHYYSCIYNPTIFVSFVVYVDSPQWALIVVHVVGVSRVEVEDVPHHGLHVPCGIARWPIYSEL